MSILSARAVLIPFLLALAGAAPPEVEQSFDLRVLERPVPATIGTERWLVYELHLVNYAAFPLQLIQLQVVDAASGASLATFEGGALEQRIAANQGGATHEGAIAPGEHKVIFVELRIGEAQPEALRHVLRYARDGNEAIVTGPAERVETAAATRLGPPLRGGPWAAVYGHDWARGHRRVFYTVDGRVRLPGRFAVDWVKLDESGRTARGDADRVANALSYGEPVLAVADARVAATRQDMAESATVSGNPDHALGDAAGNFIVLALPDGRFAIYEHLRPGSVTVSAGDPVRRGQVIAEVGFTGDSTGPHLHFHVADAATPLGGEGLPYAFQAFTSLGRYRRIEDLGVRRWENDGAGQRAGTFPEANSVIRFD